MIKRNIPIAFQLTGEEEWMAMRESIMTGWLTSGPKVRESKTAFAKQHQVKHALAVTSATTALHLALVALDVGPGDEVVVPAFTWVSTANVVLHQGAKVVFCDVDPKTFNIDTKTLKAAISPRTKAIMERLQSLGISTRPGTHTVHILGYYAREFGIRPEDFPGAQAANDCSMAIPLPNRMVKEDYDYVIHCLKGIS